MPPSINVHQDRKNARITLADRGKLFIVAERNIICVEGHGSYVTVFASGLPPITLSQHLGKFEGRLRSTFFVRTHQSHLINLNYLREIITTDGYIAVLEDGRQVPVSKRRRQGLLSRL